jgi:hypothetical protein
MNIINASDKVTLGTLLNTLLQSALAQPHPILGWKPGAGMANFIDALQRIGVDFTQVVLTTTAKDE